jgi:ribosomal protein L24E
MRRRYFREGGGAKVVDEDRQGRPGVQTAGVGHHVSFGDMSGVPLNGPVLDSQVTPTGNGYYMVASDGGVFAFGDAVFAGSMGGRTLNRPVESLVPDPDGRGYWLVASDGGVFAFEAPFVGAIPGVLQPGQRLNAPVSGMVPYGNGYVLVATDGGAFVFSDQPFFGSRGDNPPAAPVLDVATTPGGYWMLAADGEVLAFGSAKVLPSA